MRTDAAEGPADPRRTVVRRHRTPAVKVTFTVSRAAYAGLLRAAHDRGVPVAQLVREALESGLWLAAVLADERCELLLRDSTRPRELRRIVGL